MTADWDRIERRIDIAAPADRVWQLVAEPGWYINDGTIVDHQIEVDGAMSVVRDPVHGEFTFRTEELDPPRYAAFRWLSTTTPTTTAEPESTLVEFWIEDRSEGGVTLRVVESGFASLAVPELEQRKKFDENTTGWEVELKAAHAHLSVGVAA